MILRASYPPRIQLTAQQTEIKLTLKVDTERYPIDDQVYLLNENGVILTDESSEYLTA